MIGMIVLLDGMAGGRTRVSEGWRQVSESGSGNWPRSARSCQWVLPQHNSITQLRLAYLSLFPQLTQKGNGIFCA